MCKSFFHAEFTIPKKPKKAKKQGNSVEEILNYGKEIKYFSGLGSTSALSTLATLVS